LYRFFHDVFSIQSGFLKTLVPAVLYTLQNNLQFIAASHLDAAVFQVLYQGKILTTALFAVLLLHQKLSGRKWLALAVLTLGVICVQAPSADKHTSSSHEGSPIIGVTTIAIACVCSGFAGVYFEMILKRSPVSIWVRNVQLSFACLVIALCGAFAWDWQAIHDHGFFQGYNFVVLTTILLQAGGGLLVAMVIKYADNILKGFATSLSVILSAIASVFFFDFVITGYFVAGATLVLAATNLYAMPDAKPSVLVRPRDEEMAAEEAVPFMSMSGKDDDQLPRGESDLPSPSSFELEKSPRIKVTQV
jgi:UDP-galactose transporter